MKTNNSINEQRASLKRNNLKVTPARLALLDLFAHNKKPLSVNDLAKKLNNKGIDTVTLYRNVEVLENLGLLKKILIGDKQTYYELSSHEHHHHLICKNCGKIEDVEGCKVTFQEKSMLKTYGFAKVIDHSLEFFGICEACINKV